MYNLNINYSFFVFFLFIIHSFPLFKNKILIIEIKKITTFRIFQLFYFILKIICKKVENLSSIQQSIKTEFEQAGFFPKVSIIIPVYNGSNYLKDAIDSALGQTYDNIEIIVINDGSTDEGKTENIALSYGNRIQYFKKSNGGVATALNFGIEKMQGEYFSWLSHDDVYEPQKIEEEVRALLPLKDRTTIIAEGCQIIDASGKKMYTFNLHKIYPEEQLQNSMFIVMRGGANGCALLIHKTHFERVGKFNPQLPTTQDYDLWFRMFRNQKVLFLDSSNVLSRSHEEQGSKVFLEDHINECNRLWIRMMDSLTPEEKIDMSGSEYIYYQELYYFLKSSSNYQEAINHARKRMLSTAAIEYEKTSKHECIEAIGNYCGVDPEFAEKKLLPLRNSKENRPRVVFYVEHQISEDHINHNVIKSANMLTAVYDVILYIFTHRSVDENQIPSIIKKLVIYHSDGLTEKHANILSILKVDLLVYSYCCCEDTLLLLKQANCLGIKTVAWSQEDFFFPYYMDNLQKRLSSQNKYLPMADVVVWPNPDSQALYGLHYANSICIPDLYEIEQNNDQNLIKYWNHLFQILLSHDEKKLHEYFSSKQISFTKNMAVKTLDILAQLIIDIDEKRKTAMEEALNCRMETSRWMECYTNVIESRSWRFTESIRCLANKLKKILHYIKA